MFRHSLLRITRAVPVQGCADSRALHPHPRTTQQAHMHTKAAQVAAAIPQLTLQAVATKWTVDRLHRWSPGLSDKTCESLNDDYLWNGCARPAAPEKSAQVSIAKMRPAFADSQPLGTAGFRAFEPQRWSKT